MRLDPWAFVKVNVPHILSGKEVILMPNSLLVGIDVSSSDNKVRLLDSSGNRIAFQSFLFPITSWALKLLFPRS